MKSIDLANKLYCTFSAKENVDDTVDLIKTNYDVLYDKIFVLQSTNNDEYILTYNVDPFNTSGELLENTILTHRKKDFNTLYTINGLNRLIQTLNNGVMDNQYKVNWSDYKNCILLTQNYELKKIDTKVFKIISLKENLAS